jgi:hypothetical protein
MITIYFPFKNTKRLEFVANHLFNRILGVEFQIISDKKLYLEQTNPSINYSNTELHHGLQIVPQGLLSENEIHAINNLNKSKWNGLFCFFYQGKGDIPFDLFAASFYLLTLYQEYFPAKLDIHGRFDHEESVLFQNNVLEIPVIDRWAYFLKKEWEKAGFYTGNFQLRKFQSVQTYDIDFPFLYRYKGLLKNVFCLTRDLFKKNFQAVKERIRVLLRLQDDPYMVSLKYIDEHQKQIQRPYYLFVLLGKSGKYGRTTLYPTLPYYNYLRNIQWAKTGLHPSYETYKNLCKLKKEKLQLEKLTGKTVNLCRRHFLRMQIPVSFQDLLDAGFTEDFTLAFAKAPGFRSGTAIPHFFYDLQKEEQTALLIRPTVLMDTMLIEHSKLLPDDALKKIKTLIDECWLSGGDYLSLWHNSNLAYTSKENPWKKVFEESERYALSFSPSAHVHY